MAIRSPDLFIRGPSLLARLVFYCALSIACIVVDYRFHQLDAFRKAVSVVIYPLQELAFLPAQMLDGLRQSLESPQALQVENDRLRQRLLQQADAVQENRSLRADLATLTSLLGLREQQSGARTVAEVIGMARNPFVQKLVIGPGQDGSIQPGAPVISLEGLVGQVTAVNPFSEEVTLITDKNQALPVMVVRNGLRTMAFGNGESGTLSLPYVPVGSDIQAGDTLVTSGIDGLYPPGLSVGTVTSVERDSVSAFDHIRCVPTSAVQSQRYVLVLEVPPRASGEDLPRLDQPEAETGGPSRPARKARKP